MKDQYVQLALQRFFGTMPMSCITQDQFKAIAEEMYNHGFADAASAALAALREDEDAIQVQ